MTNSHIPITRTPGWGESRYRANERAKSLLRMEYVREWEKAIHTPTHETKRRDEMIREFARNKNQTNEFGVEKIVRQPLMDGTWTGRTANTRTWTAVPPPPAGPPPDLIPSVTAAGDAQQYDL